MPDDNLDENKTAEASSDLADVKDQEKDSSSESETKKTLSDVVKEVADKAKREDSSSEQGNDEASKTDEKAEPVEEEVSEESKIEVKVEEAKVDEEDKKLPFHTHPRFQKLVKERNEFKEKTAQAEPALKRDAALSEFCQKNSITNDEFVSAMEIAALLHNDPKKALESLKGYVETLELTLGNKLPADLQKDVDDGAISEARAKELANLRVKSQGLEYTGKKSEAQVVQERQQGITNAVNSWDQSKRTSDPQYEKKYPLVEKAFVALCAQQPPRTPAEAIQLAEKAYTEVNTALGTLVPRQPTRKVLKSNGAATKGTIEIKPGTSLRDALPLIARQVAASHRE